MKALKHFVVHAGSVSHSYGAGDDVPPEHVALVGRSGLLDGKASEGDAEPSGDEFDLSGTAEEILAWVGDDAGRAGVALDAEEATAKPRKGLSASLSDLVDAGL